MLVDDGVGVGARTGSTGSVEGRGHHFGVAPNVERTLLVAEKEASLVANMIVFLHHKVVRENMRGFGARGSTWWYDGGGGWMG